MPLQSLVTFDVTPRFDIFYALRALDDPGPYAGQWAGAVRARLPRTFGGLARRVGPRPVMWALLADILQDAKADPKFSEIRETIQSLDNESFQRAILGGAFRAKGVVTELIASRLSLREAVEREAQQNAALVSLIGLFPFEHSRAVQDAFNRVILKPSEYRADLARALEMFWRNVFEDTWRQLEPLLKRQATAMRDSQAASSLAEFVRRERMPVVFDDERKFVTSARGVELFAYRTVRAIHFIPSAFNDARFWGAYRDASGSVTLYFPLFDETLLDSLEHGQRKQGSDRGEVANPALGFRALGDTTRYAIASLLAQRARTSVELARELGVSKATISHHVQLLREAGLITEGTTGHGVALALNRAALENLSSAAAREMFSQNRAPVLGRSRKQR